MLLNRESSFGADTPVGAYWLAHCHGFSVRARGTRNAVVEDVAFPDPGAPAAYLVVRVDGLLGSRRCRIAPAEVDDVDPWRNTVRLRGSLRAASRRTRRGHAGRSEQAFA